MGNPTHSWRHRPHRQPQSHADSCPGKFWATMGACGSIASPKISRQPRSMYTVSSFGSAATEHPTASPSHLNVALSPKAGVRAYSSRTPAFQSPSRAFRIGDRVFVQCRRIAVSPRGVRCCCGWLPCPSLVLCVASMRLCVLPCASAQTVKYVGPASALKQMVGVETDAPVGSHDGVVDGAPLFEVSYVLFVRACAFLAQLSATPLMQSCHV